jgi:hypothetical protein
LVLAVLEASGLPPELLAVLRSSLLAASCGPELVAAAEVLAAQPTGVRAGLVAVAAVAHIILTRKYTAAAFGLLL